MQVLIIDEAGALDDADLWTLRLRGYNLTRAGNLTEGVQQLCRIQPDCTLIGASEARDPATGNEERDERREIHALVRASPVGVLASEPAAVRLAHHIRERSVPVGPSPDLVETFSRIERPLLAVAARFDASLPRTIRESGRTVALATTLQFVMNLLTDGRCQTVLLETEVPGLTDDGVVTVFDRFNARHLAVLAPAAGGIGIVRRARPHAISGWIRLIESVAECRAFHCGRAEGISQRRA